MNYAQLLTRARIRLDDTALPYLWSDLFILDAYNEAIDEACLRTRGILDSTTDQLCVIPVVPNQQRYALDRKIIKVGRLKLDSNPNPLDFQTIDWLDKHVEYWDSPQRPGEPWCYATDQDRGAQLNVVLVPYPRVADVMRLSIWRMPLECEYLKDPKSEPPLPPYLHRSLTDWIEVIAYGNKDTEKYDQQRADRAEAKFTAAFGQRPSGHDLKLIAVNALRGTRPCYF